MTELTVTLPATRQAPRRYPCARCGRHHPADRMVYSTWTKARYCTDVKACEKRARRRA